VHWSYINLKECFILNSENRHSYTINPLKLLINFDILSILQLWLYSRISHQRLLLLFIQFIWNCYFESYCLVPLLRLIWWQLIHSLTFQHLGRPLCCPRLHVNINFAIQSCHFDSSAENSLRYCQQLLCRNVTAVTFKIWVGSDLHFDHKIAILTMLRPVAFPRHS
jgi:hypothetical protein